MTTNTIKNLVQVKASFLASMLESAISSPNLNYEEMCEVDSQGLYIISDETTILYIGKTNRSGKVRMRELASDFRSHTLNKKLLSKRFKDLGFVFDVLKNETKQKWIESGRITEEVFKHHQREINNYIKSLIKFKFWEIVDERELISLEHYAIAVLSPSYND